MASDMGFAFDRLTGQPKLDYPGEPRLRIGTIVLK